jgi:hypothetical protein
MWTLALAPCWAVWTEGRAHPSSKDGAYRLNLATAIPTFRSPRHVACRFRTKLPTTLPRSALPPHSTLPPAWSPLLLHARPPTSSSALISRVNCLIGAVRPNVQDEPRPWLARSVLLGARIVTATVVGSGALFGGLSSHSRWRIPQSSVGL